MSKKVNRCAWADDTSLANVPYQSRSSEFARVDRLWPHCFILDVANFRDFPYFHYLGPRLARYSGIFLSGRYDWSRTLLKKSVCHYREALERRAPVLLEEELTQYDNTKLLFRSILLPLSDDGDSINYLLGAANGTVREG